MPETKGEEDVVQNFRASITTVLENFFGAMVGDGPVFIIVQERDWRWVLALYPDARALPIVKDENVGSRRVLLVANQSGYELAGKAY